MRVAQLAQVWHSVAQLYDMVPKMVLRLSSCFERTGPVWSSIIVTDAPQAGVLVPEKDEDGPTNFGRITPLRVFTEFWFRYHAASAFAARSRSAIV